MYTDDACLPWITSDFDFHFTPTTTHWVAGSRILYCKQGSGPTVSGVDQTGQDHTVGEISMESRIDDNHQFDFIVDGEIMYHRTVKHVIPLRPRRITSLR